MTGALLVAVPNVSEGRRPDLVRTLGAKALAGNTVLLDVHSDPDHHRSVLTYAGPRGAITDTAVQLADLAADGIDVREHQGAHPRMGALDVLPFVAYTDAYLSAVEAAAAAARRIAELGIPICLYGDGHRSLPEVRRDPTPDLVPASVRTKAGITCVGVRGPLVAFNVNLRAPIETARRVAAEIRSPTTGVRALAFELPSRGLVQVSMNLVRPDVAGPREAFARVAALTDGIVGAEVVGLLPDGVDVPDELPMERPARTVARALADQAAGDTGMRPSTY